MPYHTTFASGHEKDGSVELTLPRRLFPELAEQRASASANPLVLVDALTAYLDHFPHGCTEQVVSQVFPLVGLLTHPAYRSNRTDIDGRFGIPHGPAAGTAAGQRGVQLLARRSGCGRVSQCLRHAFSAGVP
jgi:hypothetical protein